MKKNIVFKGIMFFIAIMVTINIRSINSSAESVLSKPTGVRVWRHSNTSLRVKWRKVKNADGYIIYKYNKKTKKYKKYKTINKKNTCIFIDKSVGSRASAQYWVSAYKKAGSKKVIGPKSYSVRARTYKQGDKKVNAGKVTAQSKVNKWDAEKLAYLQTVKLTAKIKPSDYSKAKGKKTLSNKLRWYSSNPNIATVDKNGVVTAKTRVGRCSVYARAHNGRKSNIVYINIKNYAKPDKRTLNLYPATQNPELYRFVLWMMTDYYDAATDIAEYFSIHRPKGSEQFKCWVEGEEIKMSPENYVSGEIKQKIYNLVNNFPQNMMIHVTPHFVNFTEIEDYGQSDRRTGMHLTYRFDEDKTDPKTYTIKHNMAINWTYGYLQEI